MNIKSRIPLIHKILCVCTITFCITGCDKIKTLWADAPPETQQNRKSNETKTENHGGDHSGHAHGPTTPEDNTEDHGGDHSGHAHATPQPPSSPTPPSDWCTGHALPESMCTKCNPSLAKSFQEKGDWCSEHEFPESVCPTCNPSQPPTTTQTHLQNTPENQDWCAEHFLPESACTKCNPALVASFQEKGDWCPEHGFPESVCPSCNPLKAPLGMPVSPLDGQTIQFDSPELERIAGIQAVPATEKKMTAFIEATARIDFNQNLTAEVRATVPGIVREMSIDLGQTVTQSDPIFILESAYIGDLQARRQAASERVKVAKANLTRQQELRSDNITSTRQLELARQDQEVAEADLRSIDQSLKLAGTIKTGSQGRFQIVAPISGTVVRRPALIGTFTNENEPLAVITNTNQMWAILEVNEWDAPSLKLQQPISLRVDGILDRDFTGVISWISPEVDPRTRAVIVRAEIQNPDGALRAHQFGRAQIFLASSSPSLSVPTIAIQHMQQSSVIFVRRAQGTYESKQVTLGRSEGAWTQVEGNIQVGNQIVTSGAFLLRTELDKESIGAGCAGDH